MQHLASFFPALLRKASADPEVALIFLQELWPQLAGADLARKCSPQSLKKKTLIIRVHDPTWERELQSPQIQKLLLGRICAFWKRRIIERIVPAPHPKRMPNS